VAEFFYFFLNYIKNLPCCSWPSGVLAFDPSFDFHRFQRVVIFLVVLDEKAESRVVHSRADLAAPVVVANRVLDDALEEHGKLFGRPVAILLGELHHRVLDDVERAPSLRTANIACLKARRSEARKSDSSRWWPESVLGVGGMGPKVSRGYGGKS
jgi:hypothetical protein